VAGSYFKSWAKNPFAGLGRGSEAVLPQHGIEPNELMIFDVAKVKRRSAHRVARVNLLPCRGYFLALEKYDGDYHLKQAMRVTNLMH